MKKIQVLIMLLLVFTSGFASNNSSLTVISFEMQRTVLRLGDDIPVVARIYNNDFNNKDAKVELKVTNTLTLVSGLASSMVTFGNLTYTEIKWTLNSSSLGQIIIDLNVISAPGDTLKAQLTGTVTDKYYKQKEFLISAWSPPTIMQAAFDYYKGANFAQHLSIGSPFSTGVNMVKKNSMKCFVNIAELIPNYGTKLYGSAGTPPEVTATDLAAMGSTLDLYKNETAVDGYMIIDEPGASRFANLAKVVTQIRAKDPLKLSLINLFPTYATNDQTNTSSYTEYISRFLNEVKPEMLSYDHYHFFTGSDGPDYFKNLGIIRNFGIQYNLPYTNIIQLIGTEKEYVPLAPQLDWRTPTPKEHRFLVYSSLAYGYSGIIWFHWQNSWGMTGYPAAKEAELYATVSQLNKEMKNIGVELMKLKSVGAYHVRNLPAGADNLPIGEIVSSVDGNQSYVVGLFKDAAQADYFMIMNKDYTTDSQTTIRLNKKLSKLEYFDATSGQWINFSDFTVTNSGSEFSMVIVAGNGILFRPVWTGSLTNVLNKPANTLHLRNYPNPFITTTTFEYTVPEDQEVELSVYNTLGKVVFSYGKAYRTKGIYTENFDATSLPAGIYFYTLKLKNSSITERMVLSR